MCNSKHALHDLEIISKINSKQIYILADFNINLKESSQLAETCTALLNSYELVICNSSLPTRVTPSSSTIIDHVFVRNLANEYVLSVVLSDLTVSDHNMLILDRLTGQRTCLPSLATVVNVVNYKKLSRQIASSSNFDYQSTVDIHELFSNFIAFFEKKIKGVNYSKIRKNIEQPLQPWATPDYVKLVRQKNKLYAQTKKNAVHSNAKADFKLLSREVERLKLKLKASYYAGLLDKLNPRASWRVVSEILCMGYGKKTPIGILIELY